MKPERDTSHFEFAKTCAPADHGRRGRDILKAHPEVAKLFGINRWSFVLIAAIAGLQNLIGFSLNHQPLWLVIACAYFLGSVISLALMVLVHDASHNRVAKSKAANNAALFIANLGILWPASLAYRRYHLNHHKNFGHAEGDVDMPTQREASWVGNSKFRKVLWLIFFPYVYVIHRSANDKTVKPKPLFMVSLIVQVIMFYMMLKYDQGFWALYLALSPIFIMTISPAMGSRGLLEHYVFKEGQETYSYYGPYNKICFNGGYHTEHHDLPAIPWNKLPKVREIAHEFYDSRYTHGSYYSILSKFINDDQNTLFNRILRVEQKTLD